LLDEPYQGFDWETYLRFWALATTLREHGCSGRWPPRCANTAVRS
jgi:hypothetical protein